MTLYDEWKKIIEDASATEEMQYQFWNDYCDQEMQIYKSILEEGNNIVEGTLAELAEKYNMSYAYFVGFLDGINESLKESIKLDELKEDSELRLDIDFRELYKNMLAVPAPWLFELDEWSNIFDEQTRKEIKKEYNRSKIVVNKNKVGRNEPCPCGSGKKYKKCCGSAV